MARTDEPVALDHYKDAYLGCRSVGHRWPNPNRWTWAQVRGPRGRVLSYRRTMECERCHVKATDVIDAGNGDSTRSYRYPEGYLRPTGHGFDRGEVRLEQVHRVVARPGVTIATIELDGDTQQATAAPVGSR